MTIRRILCRAALFAASLVAVVAARPAHAQGNDVIRGKVTGPDNTPISNVTVTATSYQGNITKKATTNKAGQFTIIFINGEGDYWMNYAAMGFAPKRFEIKRIGDEEVLLADTKMASTIATLDAVNVTGQANRALVNRNANTADVGGGDKNLGSVSGALLPPDQAGNLAALAATIPGIQLIPGMDGAADMFSALGLGGDQNNTNFNGLGSGISTLPPDARVGTSFNAYPWDPARGGFSGAQINVFSIPGSNFSSRLARGSGTGPDLEFTDDAADSTGQKSTTVGVGGNFAGPISMDNAFYNGSWSLGRRFADALTLLNTSELGLATAGVSRDSVTRLLGILNGAHVPVTVASTPSVVATNSAGLQGNIDFVPSSSGTGNSLTLAFNGNYTHVDPLSSAGSLLTSAPTRENQAEIYSVSAQLRHSNYFGFGILSVTSLGWSIGHQVNLPYLNYPQGNVRINSDLPDGSSAVKNVFFGGGTPSGNQVAQTVQLSNQLSWYSANNRHVIKVTSLVSREQNEQNQGVSPGSFSFNSLADLQAGTPSSYSRTLTPLHVVNGQLSGAASIGDYWRPKPNVQVTYGVRVDGNRMLYAPAFNEAVKDTFGIRNDVLPNKVYLSPRLGVQWTYGTAPQIAYAPGAARPPLAVIHAGVGIFQNLAPLQGLGIVGAAINSTGLPSSSRSILCIGPAAPFPAWDTFLTDPGSAPTQCADGSAGTVFSNSAPSVVALDRGFQQPRTLRSAADWSAPVLDSRFVLGVQGIYSYTMEQAGWTDLNLNPTTRFALTDEGGRPVYADPSAIVTGTGAIASSATRNSAAFQRMQLENSNLHSTSTNLVFSLKPVTANKYLHWSLYYSLLDARDQFNGFSAPAGQTTTIGSPFDTHWGNHLASGRHQVSISWSSIPIADLIFIDLSIGAKSGTPFTPMIGGDVNGDGIFNDRAFVFDPTKAADPAVAAGMQALLANGSHAARACLARQLNQIGGRGTCESPWVATGGLQLSLNPQKIGLPKRFSLQLAFTNPLALADLVAHGSNGIKGWGQEVPPDQNLLFVRGFDPLTQRFKYEVNQRFGATSPQQLVTRTPAYVSLVAKLDIGSPRERQVLTQRLDMGRDRPGTKQPAAILKQIGTGSIPNPMAIILQQPDTLKLTRKQADSLASLSRKFTLHADSIWTPVAKYLESLPKDYDHGDAYDRYVKAREQTVDYLLKIVPDVNRLLTPAQHRRLPSQVSNFLDERVLKFIRSSSAGNGGMYYF